MTDRRRPVRSRDRGFVLLLVIVVLALATTIAAWNLRRASLQAQAVQRQIDNYELHHEMLGVRDIVTVWLQRDADTSKMPEYAASAAPAYAVELPDGKRVRVHVRDGQGTLLANLNAVKDDPAQRLMLLAALARIPSDRPDLVRRSGPWEVSIRAMPDEVIDAIAGDVRALAAALRILRDDTEADNSQLADRLQTIGLDPALVQRQLSMLTFEPRLWALDVETVVPAIGTRPPEIRYYTVLAEVTGSGQRVRVHEWRPVDSEAGRARAEARAAR